MGYIYRMHGRIEITPPPKWVELRRSGFLLHEDRDIKIDLRTEEEEDGRKIVLSAAVVADRDEPRCYDIEKALQAMVDSFPDCSWTGFIEAMGEDGSDQFRLQVSLGRAVLVRPTIAWPEVP